MKTAIMSTNGCVMQASVEGIVVAQAPSAGAKAKEGSTVSLDVSSGTRPGVMVPAVVGRPSQAARAALHAAGFVVSVSVESVTQADKVGVVLAQSPAAGSRVRPGASVHITVGRTG